MTREDALLARCAALLEGMRGASIPVPCRREFDELRAELGQFVKERSEGQHKPEPVVVNIFIAPVGEAAGGPVAGGSGGAVVGEAGRGDEVLCRGEVAHHIWCPDCPVRGGGCDMCCGVGVVLQLGNDYRALTEEETNKSDHLRGRWKGVEETPKCSQCGDTGMFKPPKRYLSDKPKERLCSCAAGLAALKKAHPPVRIAADGCEELPEGWDQGQAAKESWNRLTKGEG